MISNNYVIRGTIACVDGTITALAGCKNTACSRNCLRKHESLIRIEDRDEQGCQLFIPAGEDLSATDGSRRIVYLGSGWDENGNALPMQKGTVIEPLPGSRVRVRLEEKGDFAIVPEFALQTESGKSVGMIIRRGGFSLTVLDKGVRVTSPAGEETVLLAVDYHSADKKVVHVSTQLTLKESHPVVELVCETLDGMIGW